MLDSVTLTTIILGELIFLLSLACILLASLLVRQKRLYGKLLAAYRRARHAQDSAPPAAEAAGGAEQAPPTDPVVDYLTQARDAASERYQTITQSRLPRLDPEQPFNAKVAALRYLYCEAELKAHRKANSGGDVWVTLEKQLYDLARWVIDRAAKGPGRQRNNQVRLLQQRVEKLKGFEKSARDLQRKLDLSQQKREQLEQREAEHRENIAKLRRINRLLEQAAPDSADQLREELGSVLSGGGPTSSTEQRLTNIDHIARDNQRLHSDLARGLRAYNSQYPNEREAQLEQTVRRLEAELYRSQQHVSAMHQPPANESLETAEGRDHAMGDIEESLRVIHTQMADSNQALATAMSGERSETSAFSLGEIQQLRHNNTRQRNMIVDLESELRQMRTALPEQPETGDQAQQFEELQRFERLVKECEHCILALESEVDMLYNQLQEREQAGQQTAGEPAEEVTFEQMRAELEHTAEQLEQALSTSERDAVLSQFAQAILRAESLEELSRCLISALHRAELTAGFKLLSRQGQAEYAPSRLFTEQERRLIRRTSLTGDVAYVNEGVLFASHHAHLLLKPDELNEYEMEGTEKLVHALLELTAGQITRLELQLEQQHSGRELGEWATHAHNTLVNMEIRYAYQAEEVQRLIDSLVEQLDRACHNLAPSETTRTVIDNALSECRHRVRQLFAADQTIEAGCNQLLAQIDELPVRTEPPGQA